MENVKKALDFMKYKKVCKYVSNYVCINLNIGAFVMVLMWG